MNPTSVWNPGSLLQLSGSYWQAFVLHAGVKLDIFSLLSQGTMRADQVAQQINADLRGTSMLLNALAAMGLLEKRKNDYQATQPAVDFLNRASPRYVGHMIMHHHHLSEAWSRMDEAVRTGRPVRPRFSSTSDEQWRQSFLMGMYNMACQQAPRIVSSINLEGRRHLIDLGGGPGTYAIHFCERNPELLAVVFDLPTTRPFAEDTIARHGLSHRIQFIEGDFLTANIAGDYDVAWLSHILHSEGAVACETLISKAVRLLKPGGLILIHDFLLNDNMDGPLFPTLFALNMLQATEQGQSYSETQIREMLQKSGIENIERLPYKGPTESGILQGICPG